MRRRLLQNGKISRATHNVAAWRVWDELRGVQLHDNDDDGEPSSATPFLRVGTPTYVFAEPPCGIVCQLGSTFQSSMSSQRRWIEPSCFGRSTRPCDAVAVGHRKQVIVQPARSRN